MLKNEELLLALVVKNKGDWDKTYNDLTNKDFPDEEYVEKVAKEYQGQYITILDNEYPEQLKQGLKPPFVLFYEGNIDVLTSTNTKLAIGFSKDLSQSDKYNALTITTSLPKNTTLILGGEGELTKYLIHNNSLIPYIVILGYNPSAYDETLKSQILLHDKGIIISENPFKEKTLETLANRYRIISSLCDKVFIATPIKKSSGLNILITLAISQGKDVMIIPQTPKVPAENDSINNELIYEGAIPVYNNLILCDNLR